MRKIMQRKNFRVAGLLALLFIAACASQHPMAADNGQPRMQAALRALAQAKTEAESITVDTGGHREQAIELIQRAFDAVVAGMRHATENATFVSEAQGPSPPEEVDQEVPGTERQPQLAKAIVALRDAREQLREASRGKGGYRRQAVGYIKLAMAQLGESIQFANSH
jgi:hypothetical protein